LDQLPAGHRPGLVVLSACRSATAEESANPITSVACQLHESGIEHVLGMRLSVLDDAASAFSAELFRRAARGESLGRAVTLARHTVAQGVWLGVERSAAIGKADGDLYAQWTLPVLLDRTADGPLVDIEVEVAVEEPSPLPTVLPGDGTIQLPTRADFIGRRTFIRQYLRAFLDGDSRCLLLTGPGGVGKTTLAGLFMRKLHERYPALRLLGFRAPFDLKLVYEALWHEAFDGSEEPALLPRLQAEADVHEHMRLMLTSLARRQRPCAFVLDNLEALQDIHTLRMAPAHEDSLRLLRTVCALPAPTRVLLTGRYALQELTDGVMTPCPVADAPYGDVLRKMSRLHWQQEISAKDKYTIYTVLGGNHRAIEWMA
jgi:hypothetical protein